MICVSCKQENPAENHFCHRCGKPLTNIEVTAEPVFAAKKLRPKRDKLIWKVLIICGGIVVLIVMFNSFYDSPDDVRGVTQAEAAKPTDCPVGEPIDYINFYAKAQSTGLPEGKVFCFRARIGHDLVLGLPNTQPWMDDLLHGYDAFDDEAEHEQLLSGPDRAIHTIYAQMGDDGHIMIRSVK